MTNKNNKRGFLINFNDRDFFVQSVFIVLGLFALSTGYTMSNGKAWENRIILDAYNGNVNPSIITCLLVATGLIYFGLVFLDPNTTKYRILIANSFASFIVWSIFSAAFYTEMSEGRFSRLLIITGYNLAVCTMTTVGYFARQERKKLKEDRSNGKKQ